ncbi:MAG: hypothetical protein H0X03_09385, partial [Nitrosopumilus sp.]|nr:hypothetical protein [Nitrosopumilus sp.]
MKYITLLLLSIFLIPFIPIANSQSISDQIEERMNNLTGGSNKSMNNTPSEGGHSMELPTGQAGFIHDTPGYN